MEEYTEALRLSPKLKEELKSEKAEEFKKEASVLCNKVYIPLLAEYNYICNLDGVILAEIIKSAYLDLWKATVLHEYTDGPSADKKGGALGAWINRFKPIQVTKENDDHEVIILNSVFALRVALEVAGQEKCNASRRSRGEVNELLKSKPSYRNILLYDLMWRNPGFKELSTLLTFIYAK